MKISIKLSDLESLKRDIAEEYPEYGAGHRVEAIARGLGFNTYAHLRAQGTDRPISCDLNVEKFDFYLQGKPKAEDEQAKKSKRYTTLHPLWVAVIRLWIEDTLCRPEAAGLTEGGFYLNPKSKTYSEDFARAKKEMLGHLQVSSFARSLEFLSRIKTTKRMLDSPRSYGQKHHVERWWSSYGYEQTGENNYTYHGMYVLAAIHLGIKIKLEDGGPNCQLAVSGKSLAALEERPNALEDKDLTDPSTWLTFFPTLPGFQEPTEGEDDLDKVWN